MIKKETMSDIAPFSFPKASFSDTSFRAAMSALNKKPPNNMGFESAEG